MESMNYKHILQVEKPFTHTDPGAAILKIQIP